MPALISWFPLFRSMYQVSQLQLNKNTCIVCASTLEDSFFCVAPNDRCSSTPWTKFIVEILCTAQFLLSYQTCSSREHKIDPQFEPDLNFEMMTRS